MQKNFLKWFVIFCCLYLSGCMTNTTYISPQERADQAAQLAKTADWKEYTIHTNPFILKAYGPAKIKTSVLTIYIEGDGLAWISDDMPSDNPTPINPTGLKIAVHHQKNYPGVYLARPCQLVNNQEWVGCRQAYWTNLRFSPEVINAMNQAVSYLKKYYHAKKIILIGYSGGGTIAALIAAKRSDVKELITIAAVLNVKEWVKEKDLTPLDGSLNPADFSKELAVIPQTHWVGGKDTIVPKDIAFSYANHFPKNKKPKIIIVPNFDHACCWAMGCARPILTN